MVTRANSSRRAAAATSTARGFFNYYKKFIMIESLTAVLDRLREMEKLPNSRHKEGLIRVLNAMIIDLNIQTQSSVESLKKIRSCNG
jgi:hypothetical protein